MPAPESFVRVTSFGKGAFQFPMSDGRATVGEALRAHSVDVGMRRLAVNGHPAGVATPIEVGDEVTVVPKVQGG